MANSAVVIPPLVDVLVVGGGPTALITTLVLLKNGVQALAVEQHDREQHVMYGRACILYPRSLELLDMIGVYDRIADIGFISRGTTTVQNGQATSSRGWSWINKVIAGKTYFDFCMAIRQRHVEDALLSAIAELNEGTVQSPLKLVDYDIGGSPDHPIMATLQLKSGELVSVRCKYLVGADGGRSTVRTLSNISFSGVSSPYKWVRLDAVVKTDLPHRRGDAVAIESQEHGNVLWLPNDNGRTRIGFVLNDELYGVDGTGVTAEIVMEEAKKALRPNSLEFVQLDWWTVYAIGQRVAEQFRKERVILAGDAAHTHSSGSAQGMNTGIHDATNLAWKLAGVVNGWYKDEVLDIYASERHASAQRLIELDKDVASLISGKIPERFDAPPNADVNDYLYVVFEASAGFSTGIGISYPENLLNKTYPSGEPSSTVQIGHRGPDAVLHRPGAKIPRRLQELTASVGRKFSILVFAGEARPASAEDFPRMDEGSVARYRELRQYIDSAESFTRVLVDVFQFLTIVRGEGIMQPAESIGVPPVGKIAYDHTGEAYDKYGVRVGSALVVLRPDGIVGFVAPLAIEGLREVRRYFENFVEPRKTHLRHTTQEDVKQAVGEMSVEGQVESTMSI
ncbi:hypothetical protein DAEQUDRAFT_674091 [Daedalea quercina L-15889]|uniref:FAD-binding domain-containing protein n=1 Tax=Daedalea quercina L-15889 TaxID=1314783 RepID=A0A165NHF8_9APHY|nr:hypothetical protein DAEQUDRAFT_674091 [Daedalea quercina L-15889]